MKLEALKTEELTVVNGGRMAPMASDADGLTIMQAPEGNDPGPAPQPNGDAPGMGSVTYNQLNGINNYLTF